MHPTIVSGMVIGDALVSYWPIFFPLFEEQSQKSLLKVSSSQVLSLFKVANFLLYICAVGTRCSIYLSSIKFQNTHSLFLVAF